MSDKSVSVIPLNGTNYPTWKVQCKMALMKDGLWGIVSGTETAPEGGDGRAKFQSRHDRALVIIVLSLDPSLLYLLGEPKSPVDVWKTLSGQFQKKTWANQLALRRKLHLVRLREEQSVQEHVKNMTEIFNELAIIGDTISDEDRAIYLLASLPETFSMLVTALEANNEVPKMETVVERLLHEEHKQKEKLGATAGSGNEEAMTAKQKKKLGLRCYHCNRLGHIKRNCRELQSNNSHSRPKQQLDHQKQGVNPHKVNYMETCRPDDSTDGKEPEAGLVVDHVLSTAAKSSTSCTWIIDSGASSHMCNNRKLFVKLYPLEHPVEVKLGDGRELMATAQGVVRLRMKSGSDRSRKCSLHDVLYVPELSYNLISVLKAAERGNTVKISDFGCIIRDNQQKDIGIGTKQEGLYRVHIVDDEYAHMTCTPVSSVQQRRRMASSFWAFEHEESTKVCS